jgi:positive regulator of sigma E activity
MRHQDKMKIKRRRRRQLFWLFAAAAVCALLFEEQVAVLYVLSTLAICGLMMMVAFSNLEARDAEMQTAVITEAADEMIKNSSDLSRSKRRAA